MKRNTNQHTWGSISEQTDFCFNQEGLNITFWTSAVGNTTFHRCVVKSCFRCGSLHLSSKVSNNMELMMGFHSFLFFSVNGDAFLGRTPVQLFQVVLENCWSSTALNSVKLWKLWKYFLFNCIFILLTSTYELRWNTDIAWTNIKQTVTNKEWKTKAAVFTAGKFNWIL